MAEEGRLSFHPLEQFELKPLFPRHADVVSTTPGADGGVVGVLETGDHVALTVEQARRVAEGDHLSINLFDAGLQHLHWFSISNMTLWMAIGIVAVVLLLVTGTRGRAIVPSRWQSIAEVLYGFVYKMIEDVTGKDAIKFFPFIMTIFLFILTANILGLIPMSFATTSHIAVTGVLALAVFVSVTVLGFVRNGTRFLGLFWVSSAPLALRPVLAIIEVISYFVRPVSHSIRLGGNIMAGHAVIKVFAGFATIAVISPLSILGITAIYGLELMVAAIQAYVFTILTCVYLKDALHPGH